MVKFKTVQFTLLVFVCTLFIGLSLVDRVYAQSENGETLIEAIGTEPTNLDPFKARRRPELTILPLILEPLFVVNTDLKIEPLLVDSWDVSDDGLTWTLFLKKEIRFHDGNLLTAEDVKYSLEKHKKGSSAGLIKPIEKVTAVNDHTVRIKLLKPYPVLLNSLASFNVSIVSKEAAEKAAGEWGSEVIVGTGAYKFKNWISGDKVVLERNDDYKHGPSFVSNKGPAHVKQWIIRFIPEPTTLLAELLSGDVDLSDYITERDIKRVERAEDIGLVMAKSTSAIYLAINCASDNAPFNDLKVRRAMAHSVNSEAVQKAAMSGIAEPLYTSISPTSMGFLESAEDIGKKFTQYDPQKAKQLLDEAGWIDSDGDGIREKDGQPLLVNFLAFSISRYKRMAEVATPMLEQVGFKVDLKVLEAGDLYERVLSGNHDLLSTGLVASQGFAAFDLADTLHSDNIGSILQWCHYNNPEMDRLIDTMRYDPKDLSREQAMEKIQKMAAQEVTVVPIANAMEIFAYKDKVLGGVEEYIKHPWAFDQADAWKGLEIFKK